MNEITTAQNTTMTAIGKLSSTLGFAEQEIKNTLKNMIVSAKNQHGAQCTDAELMVFTSICAKYELDPFVKEVHAFISGGKLMFCVGVDGWFKIMSRNKRFDGIETDAILDAEGKLVAIRARLYLKGITRPVCATEYLAECRMEKSQAWQKYPHRMLENKAIAQAIRRGMGVSGIVDEDEKRRIIDSQEQQPIQAKASISIDYIRSKMSAAKTRDELQSTARDLRKQLEDIGTWSIMKDELVACFKKYDEALSAEDAVVTKAAMQDIPEEEAPTETYVAIVEPEIVDEETGEILQSAQQQAAPFITGEEPDIEF